MASVDGTPDSACALVFGILELRERIFDYLVHQPEKYYKLPGHSSAHPRTLAKYARVNKSQWNSYFTPQFYAHHTLNPRGSQNAAFINTIAKQPHLAQMIRSIWAESGADLHAVRALMALGGSVQKASFCLEHLSAFDKVASMPPALLSPAGSSLREVTMLLPPMQSKPWSLRGKILRKFCAAFKNLRTLTFLRLRGLQVPTWVVSGNRGSALTHLTITGLDYTDVAAAAPDWTALFQHLPNLKVLKIDIRTAGLADATLPPKLQELELSGDFAAGYLPILEKLSNSTWLPLLVAIPKLYIANGENVAVTLQSYRRELARVPAQDLFNACVGSALAGLKSRSNLVWDDAAELELRALRESSVNEIEGMIDILEEAEDAPDPLEDMFMADDLLDEMIMAGELGSEYGMASSGAGSTDNLELEDVGENGDEQERGSGSEAEAGGQNEEVAEHSSEAGKATPAAVAEWKASCWTVGGQSKGPAVEKLLQ